MNPYVYADNDAVNEIDVNGSCTGKSGSGVINGDQYIDFNECQTGQLTNGLWLATGVSGGVALIAELGFGNMFIAGFFAAGVVVFTIYAGWIGELDSWGGNQGVILIMIGGAPIFLPQ